MELGKLLSLENPSLEQLGETEALLIGISKAAREDIERLDAEDRAHAADRLIGADHEEHSRAQERAAAVRRRDDADETRNAVQAKMAAVQCRIEKEADEAAWEEVRSHLRRRRAAMGEIQQLLDQVEGLYDTVMEAGATARKVAPVKVPAEKWNMAQGAGIGQVSLAVLARLHSGIGHPMSRLNIGVDQLHSFERAVRTGTLPEFLDGTDNIILNPVA